MLGIVGGGWGVGHNPTVTVWTALDAATVENGCMQIVPGSHKGGMITEQHFPSPEQLAEHAPPGSEMDLEAEPGETILLNNLLFVGFTFTVLLGTLYPLIVEAISSRGPVDRVLSALQAGGETAANDLASMLE